ncbi:MAG: GDP-mannose 4,6-dehydratase [Chloroherpetonaceae bacterium]|nr:GDP-mannose 4,6-dehydratase [Chthonomonadaceae bacterium]MDW8207854.1 GDP-mannose 4,6-dehydratase [Chloroherpetonaceae bacterium]
MSEQNSRDAAVTRVLITGAGGFVGRHLLRHLLALQEPVEITATVAPGGATDLDLSAFLPADRTRPAPIAVRELDIRDAPAVAQVLIDAQPDQIYHLAARASGAETDRETIFAVNVEGTRNVLEAAARLSPFPRVLVVSTGYVYGETDPQRPARETDPIGPLWKYGPYTDSKIEMESVARSYRGFVLIARPFAHTGPEQQPRFAVPSFARQLARIERGLDPPEIPVGNLDVQRDLLDVRDVVRAYQLMMRHGSPGEIYNVALGSPIRMADALDYLRALCNTSTRVRVDTERLRPTDILCSTGDPFALRARTGWQPHYTLQDTLRDTLNYWRQIVALC